MNKGINYNQVTVEEGAYWCIQTVADYLEVSYDTVYYHTIRTNKEGNFTPFIRSFEVVSNNGKNREQLFLKVPEAVMELSRCIPSLRFNPVMNDIMRLSLDVQQEKLKVAKIEDIDYLKRNYKELMDRYEQTRNKLLTSTYETINLMNELSSEKLKNLDLRGNKNQVEKLQRQLLKKDYEIKRLTRQLDEVKQQSWSNTRRINIDKEIVSMRKTLREKETVINSLKKQIIKVREYYKEKLNVMEMKLNGEKPVKNPTILHYQR